MVSFNQTTSVIYTQKIFGEGGGGGGAEKGGGEGEKNKEQKEERRKKPQPITPALGEGGRKLSLDSPSFSVLITSVLFKLKEKF